MLIYRIAPGLGQRWLDDELVVYQPERRQTHLLDRQAGELLDLLARWPAPGQGCDERAIARQLLAAGSSDLDNPNELAEVLVQLLPMLEALSRLGLLVTRPC